MHSRLTVALRPALVAVALFSTSSRLPAQRAEPAPRHDTPLVPLTTRWPSREGVALMAPHLVNPMAIEATSDGWVVLHPLRPAETRDEIPTSRLYASPEDVQRWTTAAHLLLTRLADTARKESDGTLPTLGRGRIRLAPYYRIGRYSAVSMQLVGCDGVWYGMDFAPNELEALTAALEHAAYSARRGAERPKAPTLDRPYYSSEVGCAVRRVGNDPPPRFPSTMPRSSRRYTEVGATFVVDTAGFVEAGSIVLLPGAPAALARATRTLVERWRYRPAEWTGLPVRQIVNAVLAFDPDEEATRGDSLRLAVERSEQGLDSAARVWRRQPVTLARRDGGWVHVRAGRWRSDGRFDGHQEWFHPDSVDAWVARVRELVAADSSPARPSPSSGFTPIFLGPPRAGNRLVAQYQGARGPDERPWPLTLMAGCGSLSVNPTRLDLRLLDQLGAAARDARLHRASPPSGEQPLGGGEVACSPFIPAISVARPDLPGVSRYPRGPYPETLSKENVRAEVLSSFVVDTTGTAIASTLVVAPGADPRAATVLRQWIDRLHFQPASRAGQKVSSRVVRTWLFEPPTSCSDERNGPDCARPYSKEQ